MKSIIVALLFVFSAVLAEEDLCQNEICRMHPHAECRIDKNTNEIAWYEWDNKIDCDECPEDAPTQDCDDKVCSEITCDNHPDAPICRMYNCGMCAPEFFNPGSNDPLDCWGPTR